MKQCQELGEACAQHWTGYGEGVLVSSLLGTQGAEGPWGLTPVPSLSWNLFELQTQARR